MLQARLLACLGAGLLLCLVTNLAAGHELVDAYRVDALLLEPAAPPWDTPVEQARRLVDQYRRTGNDALLERGWEVLAPQLTDTAPLDVLLAAAWLAQAAHDFERAAGLLDTVLEKRPDHGEAWLLRAAISLVQGDLSQARRACAGTMSVVPMAVTAGCFARLGARQPGGAVPALQRLTGVLALEPPQQTALLGWLHGVAADVAVTAGQPVEAAEHYRVALLLAPSVVLRAAFADLLLAQGRADEALAVLDTDSGAPALVLRRLLAERSLGELDPAHVVAVDDRFAAWIASGDLRHAREMARFYLDLDPQPARALELAERNYIRQREPEDLALLCEAARRVAAPAPMACAGLAAASTPDAEDAAHG